MNVMLKRELQRFVWIYENGNVILRDKKKGIQFELPLYYLDSLTRAGISFRNQYRIEQTKKLQEKLQKVKLSEKAKRQTLSERLEKKVDRLIKKYVK